MKKRVFIRFVILSTKETTTMKKFVRIMLVATMCCMIVFSAVACDKTPAVHEHEWEIAHDSNNHWYKCKSCEETKDLAEHTLSIVSSTDADCTTEGVTLKRCDVCGYEKETTTPAINHNYTLNHDETKHWMECGNCHDKKDEANHTYDSFVRFDGVYHTKICSVCSLPYKESGEIAKFTHTIVDGNCSECNSTELPETAGLIFEENGDFYTVAGIESNAGASDIVIPTFHNGKIVSAIKESAFEGNTSLRSIVIPDGVTTIGRWAFWDCTSLSTITIGKGVKTFGNKVFGSTNISRVNYTGTAEDWCRIEFTDEGSHPFYSSVAGSRQIWLDEDTAMDSVTIPDDMTKINAYSFYQCESITNITVGKNVEEIGESAFYNCTNLAYIDFADAPLESIGEEAFYGCALSGYNMSLPSSLTTLKTGAFKMSGIISMVVPGSVTTIGQDCFLGCTSLTRVELGAGVQIIGGSAFKDCFALSSVVLNEGLKEIWASAFNGCEVLKNVTIPNTVEEIFGMAFYDCAIESVTIPATCKSVGYGAFQACGALKSLTIEGGSTPLTIGDQAFYGCALLTDLVVPDRVTEIGKQAFMVCGLTKASIGTGVTKIGTEAFSGCHIAEFTIADGNDSIAYINGCIVDLGTKTVIMTLAGATVPDDERVVAIGKGAFKNSDIQTVVIPERITSVGDEAFRDCKNLVSVTLPNSMEVVPDWIFAGCEKLESVTFGNNVTEIGKSSFKECAKLSNVTIPATVTKIGASAFYKCALLVTSLGENVESVGTYAFSGCTNSFDTENGIHYIGKWAVGCVKDTTTFALREDTIGIAGGAFNFSTFATVVLPSSVKYIGDEAFSENTALTSITLSSNLVKIGTRAFSGCDGLTEVTIPASVDEIGSSAFNCPNLTKVTFENTAGWKRYSSLTASGYTVDVTNPADNANSFKGYSSSSYIWKREA